MNITSIKAVDIFQGASLTDDENWKKEDKYLTSGTMKNRLLEAIFFYDDDLGLVAIRWKLGDGSAEKFEAISPDTTIDNIDEDALLEPLGEDMDSIDSRLGTSFLISALVNYDPSEIEEHSDVMHYIFVPEAEGGYARVEDLNIQQDIEGKPEMVIVATRRVDEELSYSLPLDVASSLKITDDVWESEMDSDNEENGIHLIVPANHVRAIA
jgi:hypothetical protein